MYPANLKRFSLIFSKFILHVTNNQFYAKFTNGGWLLSSVLLLNRRVIVIIAIGFCFNPANKFREKNKLCEALP